MPGENARLEIIDDSIGFDETVIFDVLALLLDPGGGLKKREAEGYLALTSRRLIFATAWHGILVDLSRKEIRGPTAVRYRWMMAHLIVGTDEGTEHTFVLNKRAAQEISFAINKSRPN